MSQIFLKGWPIHSRIAAGTSAIPCCSMRLITAVALSLLWGVVSGVTGKIGLYQRAGFPYSIIWIWVQQGPQKMSHACSSGQSVQIGSPRFWLSSEEQLNYLTLGMQKELFCWEVPLNALVWWMLWLKAVGPLLNVKVCSSALEEVPQEDPLLI